MTGAQHGGSGTGTGTARYCRVGGIKEADRGEAAALRYRAAGPGKRARRGGALGGSGSMPCVGGCCWCCSEGQTGWTSWRGNAVGLIRWRAEGGLGHVSCRKAGTGGRDVAGERNRGWEPGHQQGAGHGSKLRWRQRACRRRPAAGLDGPGPSPNGGLTRQDEVGQWLGWGAAAPCKCGPLTTGSWGAALEPGLPWPGRAQQHLPWPGEGARERCPQGWAASGSAAAAEPLRAQQASLRLAAGPGEASAVGARGVVQGLVGAVAPDGL